MLDPSYLQLLLRLPAGTYLDPLRPILARGPGMSWDKLVQAVSRWPDEVAAHEAVATLAGFLDATFPLAVRVAPHGWWNAAQTGMTPVGWPLVRHLRTELRQPGQHFEPCRSIASLKPLVIIDGDDKVVPLASLREGAPALRQLRYRFESVPRDRPAPLGELAPLAQVERLELLLLGGVADLSPVAAMPSLNELVIEVGGATPIDAVVLAPLSTSKLMSLSLIVRAPLRAEPVILAPIAMLRSLRLDPTPLALEALTAMTSLEVLALFNLTRWSRPRLPSGLRDLRLDEVAGLADLADLAGLAQLETLALYGCADLARVDLGSLPALRSLSIGACPGVTALQLGALDGREVDIKISG